ncbi:MAG TPA: type III pantothenate kinase [Pyrinomonadaceae bacterium]|nr:type III pantothenate kinase [Pyrinomonadaceae bacterium]
MLLAIDIGNSSTKFGVFDRDKLVSKLSIPTDKNATAADLEKATGIDLRDDITAAIVASVVPELEKPLRDFLTSRFGTIPLFVDTSFDFGLTIRYQTIETLGVDRLIAASAAAAKYGVPFIICSFGTATTIDSVNSSCEYLGGVIAPGMKTMAEALHLKASRLPEVEITRPASVIGDSTISSIQSGIFYGYIGLVEGIISRMIAEMGETPRIIATGGFANTISKDCKQIQTIDENLLLEGLQIIFNKAVNEET